jgi:ParB-like chromosome segregation protein Spo0J
LGRDTVEAAILPLGEREALVHGYLQERRRRSALEEGWLLKELKERHGMSSLSMAEALQRSASWVSRRLALVTALPETIQEMVRRGAIGAHAAMRSLVPLARANALEAGKLAAAIAGKKLSTREVEDLAAAFCAGTRSTRQRLLDDPLLFLKAHKEARQAPPLNPVELLRNDFEALAAIARRVQRRLSETSGSLQDAERQEIFRCFDQARADFLRLSCRLRKEKRNAGS